MAKITVASAKVGDIHGAGQMVSLNEADIGALVGAVAGVARVAAVAGAAGLGVMILGTLLASTSQGTPQGPWTPVSLVRTYAEWPYGHKHVIEIRSFIGVCLTDEILFVTNDEHELRIPVSSIEYYRPERVRKRRSGFLWQNLEVGLELSLSLKDGSRYSGYLREPSEFEFLTPVGKQVVDAFSPHAIGSGHFVDAGAVRHSISALLEKEGSAIKKAIGDARFQQYFSVE